MSALPYYIMFLMGILLLFVLPINAQTPTVTRIMTGLNNPRGVAVLPDGRLLVAEAGTGQQADGTISIFADTNGDGVYDDSEKTIIVSEQPSYNSLDLFNTRHDEVFGLSDIVIVDESRIFFTKDDPFFEKERPNSEFYIGNTGVFEVDFASDEPIKLIGRPATLNSITFDSNTETFYIAESGLNRLGAVSLAGEYAEVTFFLLLAHEQQAVPAGVAFDLLTGDILVSFLSGFVHDYYGTDLSFMPGDAKVVRVNPVTGEQADVITDLTMAIDVAIDEHGNIFVVELTTVWSSMDMPRHFPLDDPDAPPDPGGYARFSGRVSMLPADGGELRVLAEGLDTPTNVMVADGVVYVSTGLGTPGRRVISARGITPIVGEIFMITGYE